MSDPREPDLGDLHELADARDAKRWGTCRCGGQMPGRCPGPANCPMCQLNDEDAA